MLVLCACSVGAHDAADAGAVDAPTGTVSFRRDLFPILQTSGCSDPGCHSDRGSATAHWSDYRDPGETYDQLVHGFGFDHCTPDGGSIGGPPAEPRLVPGRPDESLLVRKLELDRDACAPFFGRMPPPPRGPLRAEQIETIRTWIAEGALDD